ncbi:MAG TPA: hypothetical protein VLV78_14765 [Thermoanaerobaculia bacterium]|nr:hypothetical protein [Thermoanaerobaculia bacterium]
MTATVSMAVVVGVVCLFAVATFLSRAGQLAAPLRRLQGEMVDIRVWGEPLPVPGEVKLHLESVRAFGAGLLLFLRPSSGDDRMLLKIAQPKDARLHERGVEIADAAYVQFGGKRLKRLPGSSALRLVIS